MNQIDAIHRALIELICFLEFSDEEVVNPDLAVAQLEQTAAILQDATRDVLAAFASECEEYATHVGATEPGKADFVRSLPEALGLVQA